MADGEQLRELHDAYAWRVNAAVGDDRLDLVWQLADDYLDEALRLITRGQSAGCGRADCAVCARAGAVPVIGEARRRPRHWRSRRRG
jgi:hypothetical protein